MPLKITCNLILLLMYNRFKTCHIGIDISIVMGYIGIPNYAWPDTYLASCLDDDRSSSIWHFTGCILSFHFGAQSVDLVIGILADWQFYHEATVIWWPKEMGRKWIICHYNQLNVVSNKIGQHLCKIITLVHI